MLQTFLDSGMRPPDPPVSVDRASLSPRCYSSGLVATHHVDHQFHHLVPLHFCKTDKNDATHVIWAPRSSRWKLFGSLHTCQGQHWNAIKISSPEKWPFLPLWSPARFNCQAGRQDFNNATSGWHLLTSHLERYFAVQSLMLVSDQPLSSVFKMCMHEVQNL